MPAPTSPTRLPGDWPAVLYVVRHGESSGNVARDAAEAEGLERIDIAERDMDVPLSETGLDQAAALGRWWGAQPADEQPSVVWTSPYVRARQTAERMLEAAGLDVPIVVDERLREREFGALDGLTRKGIVAQFPDESERRTRLGKFYHRPPGGESWADVLLRLRAALDSLRHDAAGERVALVGHQVVVLLVRYVLEGMTEKDVLEVDRQAEVANCSLTTYRYDSSVGVHGGLRLDTYNEVGHLQEQSEEVTAEPDVPGAPR
ncbi:MAG TPA: histidine phosphatase family protein [Mycobacteriales bacterium]|nr:histidine phosphatase family protein [Mycobacteriales bacterium]